MTFVLRVRPEDGNTQLPKHAGVTCTFELVQ